MDSERRTARETALRVQEFFRGSSLLQSALPAVMVFLIVSDLLIDPQNAWLRVLARGFHGLSVLVVFAAVLTYSHVSRRAAVLILVAAAFKLGDSIDGLRFAYVTTLCLLFAAGGYCAARRANRSVDAILLTLLIISSCIAALQVIGVHEWVYAWSRHGFFENGSKAVIAPIPTFLRETAEVNSLNLYQARPSAIFSSNQLFTGFLLFASANTLFRKRYGLISAIFLGVGIVLSSAKAALIGVPVVAVAAFVLVPSARLQAVRVFACIVVCFFVYSTLFPGVVASVSNLYMLVSSAVVRSLDVTNALLGLLGYDVASLDIDTKVLGWLDAWMRGNPRLAELVGIGWANRLELRTDYYQGGALSLFAEAVRNPQKTACVVLMVLLVAVWSGRVSPPERLRCDTIFILAMMLFAMIANVSSSPLYWYWVGFGAHLVFGRALHYADGEKTFPAVQVRH
jgi:hypothetical protein